MADVRQVSPAAALLRLASGRVCVCVCMRARAQAGKGGEARLGSVEACGCNNEMGNEGWGEVVSGRQ